MIRPAVLASMFFGLGFSFSDGGGWLVMFMAVLSANFQLLPLRRYREPAARNHSPFGKNPTAEAQEAQR